jgi:hypothetical protein
MAAHVAGHRYGDDLQIIGDPAGDQRASTDKQTPFDILRRTGWNARKAPSNAPALRWEAVRGTLMEMRDGQPRFFMDPSCAHLHKGFMNDYVYDKAGKADKIKSSTSHVHDALQYALLGAGEGRRVGMHPAQQNGRMKMRVAKKSWNVFGSRP